MSSSNFLSCFSWLRERERERERERDKEKEKGGVSLNGIRTK